MNTTDHPDLTAYALGELDAEHAEAMARWIAETAEAKVELESVNDLSAYLQSTTPLAVYSLHPHQREAVLNGPQRVRQLVAAAQQKQPKKSAIMPLLHIVSRLAAAAVLVFAGYIAGTHFAAPQPEITHALPKPKAEATPPTSAPSAAPFKAVEVPAPVVVAASPKTKAQTAPTISKPQALQPKATPKPAAMAVAKVAESATKQPGVKLAAPINRLLTSAFVNASRDSHAEVVLRPVETRPAAAYAGPVAAALVKESAKSSAMPVETKNAELLIHSWKAEVASCPWDESHRLVRLVVQIPGEQPAAASGQEYALSIGFDANYVRSFRALGERSVPASTADAPAFHIAWYEFIPNGQASDAARVIGHVTVPNARFTTATTAPFDASSLLIVDRGAGWASARDDFLFESAIMGFGLLLKGEKNSGVLDHALVLDLALRAGAEDGERAKFAKLVKDAQKAAGL